MFLFTHKVHPGFGISGTFACRSIVARKFHSSKLLSSSLKNTPFEETNQPSRSPDSELDDFNNMYGEMFAEKSESNAKPNTSHQDDADIDLINEEMNEFFGIKNFDKKFPENHEHVKINSATEFVDLVKSKERFCLVSRTNDPIYNLSIEDYVFRNTPIDKKDLKARFVSERLLLYINDKTCVFGKNQNPFKELNLKSALLKSNGGSYDLLRRFSGGGTVIHDIGNVNYSFLTSRNLFDKKFYNSCIINTVNDYILSNSIHQPQKKVPLLMLNERGDITCDAFKVSGSAYKIAMNKSYHHGTMLIDSDLKEFSQLMRPKLSGERNELTLKEEFTECNDVDSVRSKIANLKQLTENIVSDTELFVQLLSSGFTTMFSGPKPKIYVIDADSVDLNDVYQVDSSENKSSAYRDLQSHDWTFSQTPNFTYTNKVTGCYYRVKRGTIIETNDAENGVEVGKTQFQKEFLV